MKLAKLDPKNFKVDECICSDGYCDYYISDSHTNGASRHWNLIISTRQDDPRIRGELYRTKDCSSVPLEYSADLPKKFVMFLIEVVLESTSEQLS